MKNLSKIVQESVELYNKRIEPSNYLTEEENDIPEGTDTLLKEYWYTESPYELDEEKVENFIISSQISLLEAELERKKGMMIRNKSWNVAQKVYRQLIQEDITYLEEQIEEIKKLI